MKLVRGAELLRKAEDILLTGSGKAKRGVVPTEGRLARGGAGLRHWQSAAALPMMVPALGSSAAGLGLGIAAPSRKVTA